MVPSTNEVYCIYTPQCESSSARTLKYIRMCMSTCLGTHAPVDIVKDASLHKLFIMLSSLVSRKYGI